jgi:protein-L-isoaspartate(D-aspartate) O-methyltransferase
MHRLRAWRCRLPFWEFRIADPSELRRRMVERQLKPRGIRDPRVLAAMGEVPREKFVSGALQGSAYEDGPLPIGEGQTISQPYVVALMIEAAGIKPGAWVLEVGAGSGYAAAVMARIAGRVFAIERHATLAAEAAQRLADLGYTNATVIAGDGSGGLPDEAPFDAILVAARCAKVPEPLRRQLTIGGRLIVPIGGAALQSLMRITRRGEEQWREDDLGAVRFVPLVGAHGL